MASRIDVLQDDRGLTNCFRSANVLPEWAHDLTKQHKFTTLDDFIYVVDSKNWESEVVALCEATPSLKGNRIIHARMKSAWEAGHHALKQAQVCKPWNDGRGCSTKNCPDTHGCDVRLPSGRACLAKTHTRMQHDEVYSRE